MMLMLIASHRESFKCAYSPGSPKLAVVKTVKMSYFRYFPRGIAVFYEITYFFVLVLQVPTK